MIITRVVLYYLSCRICNIFIQWQLLQVGPWPYFDKQWGRGLVHLYLYFNFNFLFGIVNIWLNPHQPPKHILWCRWFDILIYMITKYLLIIFVYVIVLIWYFFNFLFSYYMKFHAFLIAFLLSFSIFRWISPYFPLSKSC